MNPAAQKLYNLKDLIRKLGAVVIAFSAGVDSTFLLKIATLVLPKENILAVTATSALYPKEELAEAKRITRLFGVRHCIIKTQELKNRQFVANPPTRCYYCKRELFSLLKDICLRQGYRYVLDASTASDKADFRPGEQAKKELGIRSPLQEAGFTKKEIRLLSKRLGLTTWNKPSLACLASRLPYSTAITPSLIRRIHRAERFLKEAGFTQVRVRHYGSLCRLEVLPSEIPLLTKKRNQIVERFRSLGYTYITLDLAGYRTGSMNEDRIS